MDKILINDLLNISDYDIDNTRLKLNLMETPTLWKNIRETPTK